MPNKINFSYVLANLSPLRNPIIYATVIVVAFVYVVFWILAYVRDRKEAKRKQIIILSDNLLGNNYCYEIIVFTGSRKEAGTDSKVIKIRAKHILTQVFI